MKLKQISSAVFVAMAVLSVNAGANGFTDPDDAQTAKKTEIRTHVMVVDSEGQMAKMDGKMPEHATMITSNGNMHFIAAGETIKNAPFSAEFSIETIQKLADGNVISNKTTMFNARDSQGKTRRETRNSKGEIIDIAIVDPTGSVMTLNPRAKTATKMPDRSQMGKGMPSGGIKEINVETIRKTKEGGENIEVRTVVGEAKAGEKNIVIKRIGHADGEMPMAAGGAKGITIDVRGPEAGPAMGMLANGPDGAFMRLFSDSKWAAKKQSKTLGTKEIEGVKAEGKLTSYEIPAGEVGNAQAIVVSDEIWTSPELQLIVYSKHSDPRSGERIYRLTNLKRDEVPSSLFAIPADYKVRDLAKEMKVIIKESNEKIEKK
ncbi:hypothetical protein H8K35_03675 [Undibacterium sp. LX40W]|uniref:DUF4412 domain-containing protein n=1 Tax=Undibacterium nitidum TaxID=2762298 RepID=A0A923HK28_9BURK|nr:MULTISPECIES: hypothetical protein [Undibacterium]MBC3880512.1 hypothetical protein [Undibacterium nitidum]MBC3890752.1 hypothetical protein [Undibacterium sp. LX40W]